LAEGLAEQHYWVPNSGWTTFRVRAEDGLAHACWLLRISYLRYALKIDPDPPKRFERENQVLRLTSCFRDLLEMFVEQPLASGTAARHSAKAW
jgi:Family of unknown function (DUF5519)